MFYSQTSPPPKLHTPPLSCATRAPSLSPFSAHALARAALLHRHLRGQHSPATPSSPTNLLHLPHSPATIHLCVSAALSTAALSTATSKLGRRRLRSSMAEVAIVNRDARKVAVFDSEDDLAVSLAQYTAEIAGKFAAERSAFSVVLSGGSLVKSMRKLLEEPYVGSIEWAKWHVFWVDERVVPKDHEDSNYKLAYDGFLSKVSIPPGQVYAINDALSAEGAADDYEICLKQLVQINVIATSSITGLPKFDLMLLGMGPDGHVASLFPGHPLVKECEKWVTYIKDSPKPPPERITFTFPVINSSSYVALVVTGAGKADAVHKALDDKENSDPLPARMVSMVDGETTWFLDKGAASKL